MALYSVASRFSINVFHLAMFLLPLSIKLNWLRIKYKSNLVYKVGNEATERTKRLPVAKHTLLILSGQMTQCRRHRVHKASSFFLNSIYSWLLTRNSMNDSKNVKGVWLSILKGFLWIQCVESSNIKYLRHLKITAPQPMWWYRSFW